MAETDGPIKFKGLFQNREVTPAVIPLVVGRIAEVKNVSPEEAAAVIFSTCKKVFPKLAEAEKAGGEG